VMPMMGAPVDEATISSGEKEFERFQPVLEQHMNKRDWVAGEFSVADIAVGVWLDLTESAGLKLAPNTAALLGRLRDRPAFVQSAK
jgi:GST-like protein